MASSDKYKRGSSGYSIEDEKQAKRYGEMTRAQYQNLADRKAAGEKGIIMDTSKNPAEGYRRRAEANYKENLTTSEGRDVNRRNMEFNQGEINKLYKENSRAQYEHEKEVGGALSDLPYEEWKKL